MRPVFVEATRPRQLERAEGWNNLPFFRGVWAGGWGAYRAPIYDMEATFYPPAYSAPADPAVLELLDEMLDDWDAAAPPRREVQMAPATQDALEQLGYLEADDE